MSPHWGLGVTRQITDQERWENMLTDLVRHMPGCWKVLDETIRDEFELDMLMATESINFGKRGGRSCWRSLDRPVSLAQDELNDIMQRKDSVVRNRMEKASKAVQMLTAAIRVVEQVQESVRFQSESNTDGSLAESEKLDHCLQILNDGLRPLHQSNGEVGLALRMAKTKVDKDSGNLEFVPGDLLTEALPMMLSKLVSERSRNERYSKGQFESGWDNHFSVPISMLKLQLDLWDGLSPRIRGEFEARFCGCKLEWSQRARPPNILELLDGEHPMLPRYARHFRELTSKNVSFGKIFKIMQQHFGDIVYSVGMDWAYSVDDVPLAADGTAAIFYESLRRELWPRLTAGNIAAHDAAHAEQVVRGFLEQKLLTEVVDGVVAELQSIAGCNMTHYTDAQVCAIAAKVGRGNYPLQLDIGRGLLRLRDGHDTWSSTVSGRGSSAYERTSGGSDAHQVGQGNLAQLIRNTAIELGVWGAQQHVDMLRERLLHAANSYHVGRLLDHGIGRHLLESNSCSSGADSDTWDADPSEEDW